MIMGNFASTFGGLAIAISAFSSIVLSCESATRDLEIEHKERVKERLTDYGLASFFWRDPSKVGEIYSSLSKIEESIKCLKESDEGDFASMSTFITQSSPHVMNLMGSGMIKDIHTADKFARKLEDLYITISERLLSIDFMNVSNYRATLEQLIRESNLEEGWQEALLTTCLVTTEDTNTEPQISKMAYLSWKIASQIDERNNDTTEKEGVFSHFYDANICLSGARSELFLILVRTLNQMALTQT